MHDESKSIFLEKQFVISLLSKTVNQYPKHALVILTLIISYLIFRARSLIDMKRLYAYSK